MASDRLAALLPANQKLHLKTKVSYPCFYPGIALIVVTSKDRVQFQQRRYNLRHWQRQNKRYFADDILKCIFFNENWWISITIWLKFVPDGPINNIPALDQIKAWCQSGNKPLSEPMIIRFTTHICVTRPQWDYQNTNKWYSPKLQSQDKLSAPQNKINICTYYGLDRPVFEHCQILLHPELTLVVVFILESPAGGANHKKAMKWDVQA